MQKKITLINQRLTLLHSIISLIFVILSKLILISALFFIGQACIFELVRVENFPLLFFLLSEIGIDFLSIWVSVTLSIKLLKKKITTENEGRIIIALSTVYFLLFLCVMILALFFLQNIIGYTIFRIFFKFFIIPYLALATLNFGIYNFIIALFIMGAIFYILSRWRIKINRKSI